MLILGVWSLFPKRANTHVVAMRLARIIENFSFIALEKRRASKR